MNSRCAKGLEPSSPKLKRLVIDKPGIGRGRPARLLARLGWLQWSARALLHCRGQREEQLLLLPRLPMLLLVVLRSNKLNCNAMGAGELKNF